MTVLKQREEKRRRRRRETKFIYNNKNKTIKQRERNR
jgi:hypothetical protein